MKPGRGGSDATSFPLTPSFAHSARARVGPKVGPAVLRGAPDKGRRDPVGAAAHSCAPSQPPAAIMSPSASPTVGGPSRLGARPLEVARELLLQSDEDRARPQLGDAEVRRLVQLPERS